MAVSYPSFFEDLDRTGYRDKFAVQDGTFVAVGTDAEMATHRGAQTRVIDAGGHTIIPGLNDSHAHVVRGGRFYNLELRWDGVPSLAERTCKSLPRSNSIQRPSGLTSTFIQVPSETLIGTWRVRCPGGALKSARM